MSKIGDVDLDFGNRDEILSCIDFTPATLLSGQKHNSGIYVSAVPQNAVTGQCSLNYKVMEDLGYFKLDILNQNIYRAVKNPEHMEKLLATPVKWNAFQDTSLVSKLAHIGNYFDLLQRQPEPITSVEHLAMFLSIIRPGKKHLQGKTWAEISRTVWIKEEDSGYTFKRSHALAYATLVILQLAIMQEKKTC